jgi:transcriptional regulator with XRE-family HTH domain
MKLEEKLQMLRKQKGYSQEEMADKLGLARQTISKWENGMAVPELQGLLMLSEEYGISIDRLVKEDDSCNLLLEHQDIPIEEAVIFLMKAKKATYAGKQGKVSASRLLSHDYQYEENEYMYYDTFLGSEKFSGEEGLWYQGKPIWSMNYMGRVIGEHFTGDFLKEALSHVPSEIPYRGPNIYTKGEYHYHCHVEGNFSWFQGYEEIFYGNERIYECYFHGCIIE